jgi:hypothetical protein
LPLQLRKKKHGKTLSQAKKATEYVEKLANNVKP